MAEEILYKGRAYEVVRQEVDLPNGSHAKFDILVHPGAAAMVAVTEDRQILMLNQYRHAAGGYIWEIPAGNVETGESPEDCARRELEEETGYSASMWEKLGEITPVPGYSTEVIHLYLATVLSRSVQNLDKDEVIDVHKISLDKVFSMAQDGTIRDGKTLCALFLAKDKIF